MSLLENLPIELVQGIGSYLDFFDKMTLSVLSKSCHAHIGRVKCPDKLSWIIYACIVETKYPSPTRNTLSSADVKAALKVLDDRLSEYYEQFLGVPWKNFDDCTSVQTFERLPAPEGLGSEDLGDSGSEDSGSEDSGSEDSASDEDGSGTFDNVFPFEEPLLDDYFLSDSRKRETSCLAHFYLLQLRRFTLIRCPDGFTRSFLRQHSRRSPHNKWMRLHCLTMGRLAKLRAYESDDCWATYDGWEVSLSGVVSSNSG